MPKTFHSFDPLVNRSADSNKKLKIVKKNKNGGQGEYNGNKIGKFIFLDHILLQLLLFFKMVLKATKMFLDPRAFTPFAGLSGGGMVT